MSIKTLMNLFVLYLIFVVIFTTLDVIWLGFLMRNFYLKELGDLARQPPLAIGGLMAYLLLTIAPFVYIFSKESSILHHAFQGALLGLFIYGIYEFTNFAMLKNWPLKVVIIDTFWGISLYAISCGLVAWIGQLIYGKGH